MSNRKRRIVTTAAACTALLGAVGLASNAAMNPQSEAKQDQNAMTVGTYEPQAAFEQYHLAAELQQKTQEIQMQMQQAQQAGDQQKMMQLQQQAQQQQNQVIEQFYSDVEAAAESVARSNDLDLMAVEIVYTADRVGEPKDVTEQIIENINEGADTTNGAGSETPQNTQPQDP